jgi:hypothetical protein
VAGDVGARGVEDVREVPAREVFLDQLLAKLALHEGIRRDLPDKSGRLLRGAVAFDREVEEPLHEWHGERILAAARKVARAVELAHCAVLHGDVGRIADDGVVLLPEDAVQGLEGLYFVMVLEFVAERFFAYLKVCLASTLPLRIPKSFPMEEGVPHGQMNLEIWSILEPLDRADSQGRQEQPEASDGDCEGIEIHAEDTIERILSQHAWVLTGAFLLPDSKQTSEPSEREVS